MQQISCPIKRGSVYIITLFTVAAIVSMVLIGVRLRMATNSQSAIIEQMSEGSMGVLDATEYAFQQILDDSDWNTTSQSGVVFDPITVGDSIYSSTVVDTATGLVPTESTTNYGVKVNAQHRTVKSSAQIEVLQTRVDYIAILNSLRATHYWPMNEAERSSKASDPIGSYTGEYLDPQVPGAGTNDHGALVPVFADANDSMEVPWGVDFIQPEGSISLWMKLTNESRLDTTSLIGSLYQSGGNASINISIWNFTVSTYICDDGSFSYGNFATSTSETVTPNTWHHIVMTWGANGLFTYIDGIEAASNRSNTMGLKTARANKGGEQPFYIGSGYLLTPFTHIEKGFDGSIAHVAFIPAQLKGGQVAELAAIKPDLLETSIVEDSWVRVFE